MKSYIVKLGYKRNSNTQNDVTQFELGKNTYELNGVTVKHHINMELVVGYRATPIYDRIVVTLFYEADILG